MENKTQEPKDPKATIEFQPCHQEELKWWKYEKKSIQVKLLDFYKSKTNKSCVDIFSFLQPRLTMTQTMELARLPLLGKTSKLLPSKQNCKKEGFLKLCKHGIHRKFVRSIEKKIIIKTSLSTLWNNRVEHKGPEKNRMKVSHATRKKRTKFIFR